MKNKILFFVIPFLVIMIGLVSFENKVSAFTNISTQLSEGSRGVDVTNLQTFLASNGIIYPQGLVTGYYGPLTRTAVTQLQIGYGLTPTGKVDGAALFVINNLISSGKNIDVTAPVMSMISISPSTRSTDLRWSNNEAVLGRVIYSTSPMLMLDANAAKTEPFINVSTVTDSGYSNNKSVTIGDLERSTVYYYVVESIDSAGNVTLTSPQTFITS